MREGRWEPGESLLSNGIRRRCERWHATRAGRP